LIGTGILPLRLKAGETPEMIGLTGFESYGIDDIAGGVSKPPTVHARRGDGSERVFTVMTSIETPDGVMYHRHGGVLPCVLRRLVKSYGRCPRA
jgi:aconitate hydratase